MNLSPVAGQHTARYEFRTADVLVHLIDQRDSQKNQCAESCYWVVNATQNGKHWNWDMSEGICDLKYIGSSQNLSLC
jgi:hypothetical protein